ncbi:MAG: Hsp33 family molecular chaperone HslO [Betaproteobacteria bacterium]|jgi:molecular chaperone Hsp33|nr:MAG: Hsp33 family molecular chaperone HslO [Betaproteobacteria bacterium]
MSDSLQRFLLEGTPVRGEIVQLDATWRAVLERRDYPQPLETLLGEMMAAGALLSATLKFDGALIMQMQGDGPIRLLVVEATSEHTLRATAKWEGDIPPGSIRTLLGNGKFVITIAPEAGKQAYQGVVALEGATMSEVLEHYMKTSEQLDTRLWLASDTAKAGGLLLQRLPGRPNYDPDAWNRATKIGETITKRELLNLPARDIIHRLYHQEDIRLFDERPTAFRCSCTRERVTAMLRLLGSEEVHSVLSEQGLVEVACEFCGRQYVFDAVDAEQVFATDIQTSARQTRH